MALPSIFFLEKRVPELNIHGKEKLRAKPEKKTGNGVWREVSVRPSPRIIYLFKFKLSVLKTLKFNKMNKLFSY